jgi:hypothetical protein
MGIFRRMVAILFSLLIVVVIWVGLVIYLNHSTVELKGDFLGLEVDYERTLVEEDMGLGQAMEAITEHLKPIEPEFNLIGFENLLERIDDNLVVEPRIFHELQSEAVIERRGDSEEQGQAEEWHF